MIRASKQVVPKNKVVDHLALYNFYFDRDSSANMKFGVLDSQNLIKNTQTRYCAPCFCHGDGVQSRRRHASPCRRDPAPLKLSTAVAIAKSDFASPFPFLARAKHAAELSRAPPPPKLRWPPSAISPPFPRASNPPKAPPPRPLPPQPRSVPDCAHS